MKEQLLEKEYLLLKNKIQLKEEIKNEISHQLYFLLLNYCINTKKEKDIVFNKLILFDIWKTMFLKINLNNKTEIEDCFFFLNKDDINFIKESIDMYSNNEFKDNKIYQIFISALLKQDIEILDKSELMKNYKFNSIFLTKNSKYFDSNLISISQTNKCKGIKSSLNIVKEEILENIKLKDIDLNIFNSFLTNICNNYMDTTVNNAYEIYYIYENNDCKIKNIIEDINSGYLNLNKFNSKHSSLNKFVYKYWDVTEDVCIKGVNSKIEIYPLYGLYGDFDIKRNFCKKQHGNEQTKTFLKKYIIKNSDIHTQSIFAIIKPMKKNDKFVNFILFLILDIPSFN